MIIDEYMNGMAALEVTITLHYPTLSKRIGSAFASDTRMVLDIHHVHPMPPHPMDPIPLEFIKKMIGMLLWVANSISTRINTWHKDAWSTLKRCVGYLRKTFRYKSGMQVDQLAC
eukprot:GHVN01046442.1.p1 GENE.GHVN01046442.1~~GHVN01046442.1.p1  ORF type:complete len:115 (-),score=0.34 GHVN01046442.1:8-352(-)